MGDRRPDVHEQTKTVAWSRYGRHS